MQVLFYLCVMCHHDGQWAEWRVQGGGGGRVQEVEVVVVVMVGSVKIDRVAILTNGFSQMLQAYLVWQTEKGSCPIGVSIRHVHVCALLRSTQSRRTRYGITLSRPSTPEMRELLAPWV